MLMYFRTVLSETSVSLFSSLSPLLLLVLAIFCHNLAWFSLALLCGDNGRITNGKAKSKQQHGMVCYGIVPRNLWKCATLVFMLIKVFFLLFPYFVENEFIR